MDMLLLVLMQMFVVVVVLVAPNHSTHTHARTHTHTHINAISHSTQLAAELLLLKKKLDLYYNFTRTNGQSIQTCTHTPIRPQRARTRHSHRR